MRALYETNAEFKEYVDRYSHSRGISVEEALTHKTVRIVGEWIIKSKQ
jgi:hypothetical protein